MSSRAVVVLSLAAFVSSGSQRVGDPLLPLLAKDFGTTAGGASAVLTAFAIGGSHGLPEDFLNEAHERWSLGPATLPHELARVIALEQLYRAFTILRKEPYHKGGGP